MCGGGLGEAGRDVILNYHALPVNIYGFKTGSSRKGPVLTMPRWLGLSVKFPVVKSFLLVVTTWKEREKGQGKHLKLSLWDLNVFIPDRRSLSLLLTVPFGSPVPQLLHLTVPPKGNESPHSHCISREHAHIAQCL